MGLATNYIDDLYFRSSRILAERNYYLDSGPLVQHSINWVRFKAIQIVLQSSQVRFLECCSAIITIITRWIPWAASPSRRESAQMAELLLTPGGGAPGLRGVPYYSVPQCGVPYNRPLAWPSCATMQWAEWPCALLQWTYPWSALHCDQMQYCVNLVNIYAVFTTPALAVVLLLQWTGLHLVFDVLQYMQRCKKRQMRQIYLCYFFQLVLIFGPFWVIFGPFDTSLRAECRPQSWPDDSRRNCSIFCANRFPVLVLLAGKRRITIQCKTIGF